MLTVFSGNDNGNIGLFGTTILISVSPQAIFHPWGGGGRGVGGNIINVAINPSQ